MLANNFHQSSNKHFHKSLPILIHPTLYQILFAPQPKKGEDGKEIIAVDKLSHSQRPYRVLVDKKGFPITEWMAHPNGFLYRTPMDILRKEYLQKGNTQIFFLDGVLGKYMLLHDGTFKAPQFEEPLRIIVNGREQIFEDIYPHLKFLVQANAEFKDNETITKNVNVGVGWRKNIMITDNWEVDFTITLLVHALEKGWGWEVIASDPKNERYKYETSLTFKPDEHLVNVWVRREKK